MVWTGRGKGDGEGERVVKEGERVGGKGLCMFCVSL